MRQSELWANNSTYIYCLQGKCVINDPLSQTVSPAISDHYFHLEFVLYTSF